MSKEVDTNMKSKQQTKTSRPKKLKPSNLEEASRTVPVCRYLFKYDKDFEPTSPHEKLFVLVANSLLKGDENPDLTNDLFCFSFVDVFIREAANLKVYTGDSMLHSILYTVLPTADKSKFNLRQLQFLVALMELFNLNFLNYSVYVEKKLISKYRLFDIIETTVFTQILATEINSQVAQFKQQLAKDIHDLRVSLILEKHRGLGKLPKNTTKELLTNSPNNTTLEVQPSVPVVESTTN